MLLCFSVAPLSSQQFGLFTYWVHNDGVTITGYPEDAVGHVEIPAEIDGKPVTGIGPIAFNNSSLTGVTFPDSLTDVHTDAFAHCRGLTTIVIPAGVEFHQDAFSGCTNLTSVTFEPGVLNIRRGMFSDTGLTSATIPDGVTSVGDSAFARAYWRLW